jgi:serine/threonine protein phosphatase PrpC
VKNPSLYPLDDLNKLRLNQSLCEAYQLSHNELCKKSQIDSSFSGSTAVAILIRGKQCICSNTGDSRAVLGRFNKTTWEAIPLSKDHKPDDPIERIRIERSNGRVEAYKDHNGMPIGPLRVWLKNEQFPGLAMSRSIGDSVSMRAGVICIPDVTFQTLDSNDKFIIIASDGIWEFITNDECVQIVSNFYFSGKLAEACEQLIKIAKYRWTRKDIHIDDITVIIVSLKVKD